MELKDGKAFSAFEKRAILWAIGCTRDYYQAATASGKHDVLTSCPLLYDYLEKYFSNPDSVTSKPPLTVFANSEVLGDMLFKKLHNKYHNSDFYNNNGLQANNSLFWWPLDDIKSRLKAMDVLEQAIIND